MRRDHRAIPAVGKALVSQPRCTEMHPTPLPDPTGFVIGHISLYQCIASCSSPTSSVSFTTQLQFPWDIIPHAHASCLGAHALADTVNLPGQESAWFCGGTISMSLFWISQPDECFPASTCQGHVPVFCCP